jgi:hypothetical protein
MALGIQHAKRMRHLLFSLHYIESRKYVFLPSFGLLRDVRWFDTDVSGLFVYSIFKGQAVQEIM